VVSNGRWQIFSQKNTLKGAPMCCELQAMVIPLLLKCIEAADDEDSAYCH